MSSVASANRVSVIPMNELHLQSFLSARLFSGGLSSARMVDGE